tara:strand:- start:134487 stop:134717 length:231 start_codon:yes stop_codon:yes gene_type:complete
MRLIRGGYFVHFYPTLRALNIVNRIVPRTGGFITYIQYGLRQPNVLSLLYRVVGTKYSKTTRASFNLNILENFFFQ